MKNIGVLGACFNPPTLGHKSVILQALPHFDTILLVPSLKHPFDKQSVAIEHRLYMIRLLLLNLTNIPAEKTVALFNVEAMLLAERARPYIYTFDVLEKIEKYYDYQGEAVQIRFIIGPDNANPEVWQKFYKHEDITKRWNPFVVSEKVSVRSEQVRTLIRQHAEDDTYLYQALKNYLDPNLIHYVLRHKFYVA